MMPPTQVIPVAQSPLNTAKSFLLVGDRVVLVDGGPPGGERRVDDALARARIDRGRVSLILVTHAHPDHVGGVAALRRSTGAPIATHRLEVPYVEGHARTPAHPTGLV